jgi:hypothetical protein
MSTVNNGPQIVRSGLILDLDASSRKSYPAIEVLIVAGGGSGGVDNGGGGGGGGVISTALNISVSTAYSIVVGAGGAARLGSSDDGPGNNGANSTAFGYTAIGGSGGTGWVNTTLPPGSATYSGGSGAGQSVSTGATNSRGAGTSTSGQGYNGGTGVAAYAGGGGGAGGLGGNATSGNVGAGGEGLYVGNLFGYSVGVDGYVAGGGAGGFDYIGGYRSTLPFTRNGTTKKLTETGEDSCPNNTGAGGNGANHDNENSGGGGSGVVFVRYFGSQRATGGTIYSFRGYTIHRFDSNGTFTLTSGDTTTWYDLSGNNNNGTLITDPLFNSSNGGYIAFDGSNDYVSITQNSNTRLQNNYQTLSFFVYITSLGPNSFASLWGVGANPTGWWILWTATDISLFIETSGTYISYSVSVTNALNTWMNITCVIDNVGRTMTVYKNGSLVGTSSQWPVFTPPNDVVELGSVRATANAGDYIKGRVANVLVYNRALSAAEISQNYETDKTRFGL